MSKQRKVSIGVGVIVHHPTEKKLLISRRRKGPNHTEGMLVIPGGHIEEHEAAYYCAIRECVEETGLEIKPRNINGYSYVLHAEEWFRGSKHHWTIYMIADIVGGTLSNPEPHKHKDWRWVTLDDLVEMCKEDDWIPIEALLTNRNKIDL